MLLLSSSTCRRVDGSRSVKYRTTSWVACDIDTPCATGSSHIYQQFGLQKYYLLVTAALYSQVSHFCEVLYAVVVVLFRQWLSFGGDLQLDEHALSLLNIDLVIDTIVAVTHCLLLL